MIEPNPESLSFNERIAAHVMSTAQIREVDRRAVEQYQMHSLVLMENAALGCVHWLRKRLGRPFKAVILCGAGNNGGDGLAIARHLQVWGAKCRVYLPRSLERMSSDAHANWQILKHSNPHICDTSQSPDSLRADLADADLILDAMLGTGAAGDPREPFASWIAMANVTQGLRVAIDIPTGVNAETGEAGKPHFHAHATLTFVALKPGMVSEKATQLFGELVVLPIGIPAGLIESLLAGE
ncbi:MAG: NAD(P)H-hydrate epimerase [Planctomycetales bacterium]|nr:NAD(P)H-hydrate epimerase [Planctomycetales bacterium]